VFDHVLPKIRPHYVESGVTGKRVQDMNEMLEFAAQADIKPKCETMPLTKVSG